MEQARTGSIHRWSIHGWFTMSLCVPHTPSPSAGSRANVSYLSQRPLPQGHAGSGTSDDLNIKHGGGFESKFQSFSAAFEWTSHQVGVRQCLQTPELHFNRRLFVRWQTGRKTGRSAEWQGRERGTAADNFPSRASSRLWSHNYHLFSAYFHNELP